MLLFRRIYNDISFLLIFFSFISLTVIGFIYLILKAITNIIEKLLKCLLIKKKTKIEENDIFKYFYVRNN